MANVVPWLARHRRVSVAGGVVLVVGLAALADWPHQATSAGLREDYISYATQVGNDVHSCSTEVEQTLSAYNQIMAGVSTQRETAVGIASQTALDCTPLGNSQVQDLGAIQPPRSLARYGLDQATTDLYTWCFSDAVDVAQDVEHLLAKPGDGQLLADLRAKLTDMQHQAAAAQQRFDATSQQLGTTAYGFGLDDVRPGVVVG